MDNTTNHSKAKEQALEATIERLVAREILCCQTSLVSDLMNGAYDMPTSLGDIANSFSSDTIENFYGYTESQYFVSPDTDYSSTIEIVRAMDDTVVVIVSTEEITVDVTDDFPEGLAYNITLDIPSGAPGNNTKESILTGYEARDFHPEFEVGSLKDLLVEAKVLADYDTLAETKEELEEEPQEIFEWWLVTSWLSKELMAKGEPVLDNDYGTWWGRTYTGQSITMDRVIQEIASDLTKD